ncbi:unnamed protein product [Urochloa decumbens]|uniref:BHLH domain-containing protein n=1 Tax=Urochloa decumbens TaxID=240449 RepID=A0ABC9H2G6_9POAL
MAAAGGPFPLELSLDAAAATAAAAAEAERRRQHERAGQRRRHRWVTALYAELAAMLPNLPTTRQRPASKEKIVEAAAARVTALEGLAAALEARRRAGRGEMVAVSSHATVTVTARMPAPAQAGLLRRVVEAFERRGARVLAAAMARHGGGGGGGEGGVVVTVTAADAAPGVVEMIRADIARIS